MYYVSPLSLLLLKNQGDRKKKKADFSFSIMISFFCALQHTDRLVIALPCF